MATYLNDKSHKEGRFLWIFQSEYFVVYSEGNSRKILIIVNFLKFIVENFQTLVRSSLILNVIIYPFSLFFKQFDVYLSASLHFEMKMSSKNISSIYFDDRFKKEDKLE